MVIHVYFIKTLTPIPKCVAYSYSAIPKGGQRS